MMRRLGLSILAGALLLGGQTVALAGTLDEVRESGTFRIGFRESEPPMSFTGPEGTPIGYSIDLCERIAAEVEATLGLSDMAVEFVPTTAADRFTDLADGRFDILCGSTTKTLARSELVDFTQLTFVTGASLLALDGDDPVEALADLNDKTVAVVEGTTTIDALRGALQESSIAAEVRPVANAEEGFQLLVDGSVDAFSSDQIVLIGLVLTHEIDQTFVVSREIFSFDPFALAVRQNDSEFRLIADRVLADLNRTDEITSVYAKWFGRFSPEIPELLQALYVLNSTPE
jgi:ABC-type amino acid transport substrate-binding protein